MKLICVFVVLTLSMLCPTLVQASDDAQKPPYFASLAEEKVYMRYGPGKNYPVKWVYNRLHLPVEVTHTYDSWRKVKMPDGEFGWINHTLLSSTRTALIRGEGVQNLLNKQDGAKVVARVMPGLIVFLQECGPARCNVEADEHAGWIDRTLLWGLYGDEQIP